MNTLNEYNIVHIVEMGKKQSRVKKEEEEEEDPAIYCSKSTKMITGIDRLNRLTLTHQRDIHKSAIKSTLNKNKNAKTDVSGVLNMGDE